MKSWCHRENKDYTFSDRTMAQDYIAGVVIGRTKSRRKFQVATQFIQQFPDEKKEDSFGNSINTSYVRMMTQEE